MHVFVVYSSVSSLRPVMLHGMSNSESTVDSHFSSRKYQSLAAGAHFTCGVTASTPSRVKCSGATKGQLCFGAFVLSLTSHLSLAHFFSRLPHTSL